MVNFVCALLINFILKKCFFMVTTFFLVMSDQSDSFGIASSSIGKLVRIEFVNESRKPAISGNLFTRDPESGSVILVQQQINSSDRSKCARRFILVPGDSVHSVQLLCEKTIEKEKEVRIEEESTEQCERVNGAIALEGETTTKRTLSETVRIFDEFTLSRRLRLIDALNKYGVKFSEKPHVLIQKVGDDEQAYEDMPSTIIALQGGGIKIYPPYGKNDIIGGTSISAKELLHKLTTEKVFD